MIVDIVCTRLPPRCQNRPPDADGMWVRNGYRGLKPVIRWTYRWYVDRCAAWDGTGIGPNSERYPLAHGWAPWCVGCKWLPPEHRADALRGLKRLADEARRNPFK